MTVFSMANCTEFPPLGFRGGRPGRAREHRVEGCTVDPKGCHELLPGERIILLEAGGGGFGEPFQRARTARVGCGERICQRGGSKT